MNFKKKVRTGDPEKKQKKKDVLKNLYEFFNGRENVLNAFESKIFPIKIKSTGFGKRCKVSDLSRLKILTPRQMFQRLLTSLAQVKAGNNSENLLNEIRHIFYSLYWLKEFTKKIYNNTNKLVQI